MRKNIKGIIFSDMKQDGTLEMTAQKSLMRYGKRANLVYNVGCRIANKPLLDGEEQ